jgi:plasmid stabilization system protein ParE
MPNIVIWGKYAASDFEGILIYLSSNFSEQVVQNFINYTDKAIDRISENPNQFIIVNKNKHIRKLVLTKQNTIYFKVSKNKISILRIFDSRQNPNRLKL